MNSETSNETYVINIGRELGSGGKEIATLLAKELGIALYDRNILYHAAKEYGLNAELFEKSDEVKSSFRTFLTSFIPFVGNGDFYGSTVTEESLFSLLSKTVQRIAARENCVMLGRCTEYILRNKARCANIFISADEAERITRIAEQESISPAKAKKRIHHCDHQRASFHDYYSSQEWGSASTYHLCINSSVFGVEGTVAFLKEFVSKKLSL